MSFRELRQLTENMRLLGYPKLVSMDSFRESNFKLVAELLTWLCSIYEPKEQIGSNIESEHDRVTLIKTIANIFLTKQHIRLNTKRLYQADGYAVKELLKLVNILVQAVKNPSYEKTGQINRQLDDSIKQPDLKDLRDRVAKISRSGASLHELLNVEMRSRTNRQRALLTHLELADVEKALKGAEKAAETSAKKASGKLSNAAGDEQSVQSKIDKKRSELERTKKRLRQLTQLRPAYQDELDELQTDLKILYEDYVIKFRNAAYLESLLEEETKNQPQPEYLFNNQNNEIDKTMKLDGPGLESYDEDDLSTDDDAILMGQNNAYRKNRISDDSSDGEESADDGLATNDEDDF